MFKVTLPLVLSVFSSFLSYSAFASHPHQVVCVASAAFANEETIQFLVQAHSERLYDTGSPNTDTYLFKYQVRVCDDDNDAAMCSTYQGEETGKERGEVTLVGMKNAEKVFFKGKFKSENNGMVMDGSFVQSSYEQDNVVRKLVPLKVKLDKCINQSWVELKAEDDSQRF